MKVEGIYNLPAPRDQVWSMLMNPDVLTRCLPGCESLELEGEHHYKAALKIGIAAIKGAYSGSVSMKDLNPPLSYSLQVESTGKQGFVRGIASITLQENGGNTVLAYEGEGQVGGPLASVGQRVLKGAAASLLRKFFEAFEEEVTSVKES